MNWSLVVPYTGSVRTGKDLQDVVMMYRYWEIRLSDMLERA